MTRFSTPDERKAYLIEKMARVRVTKLKLLKKGPCPKCRGTGKSPPEVKATAGESAPTLCQACVGTRQIYLYDVRYYSASMGANCEDRLASPTKLSVKDFKAPSR